MDMKNVLYLLAFVAMIFSACEKNEVAPRTNPRFSVTLIQEISKDGAIFQAEMIDYGNDEILEYGFTFSEFETPRIGSSEAVSKPGRPERIFQMIADYGLRKGRTYFVSAFIKTSQGVVYSESTEFRSEGSKGFEFEKIEGGTQVYFEDSLTVFGQRLSTSPGDYSVKVNGVQARVVNIQEESFKVIIPRGIAFEPYDTKQVGLVLDITIADVKLELRTEITFYEPEFYQNSKEFKYSENFFLKGKYLRGDDAWIRSMEANSYGDLPIVSMTDTLVVFGQPDMISTLNPGILFYLRGKLHTLEGYTKIQKSEIDPNQKVQIGTHVPFKITGNNFIVNNPRQNVLISDYPGMDFSISGATSTELEMNIYSYYAVPNPRFFTVYLNNANERSTNGFQVENTAPFLAFKTLYAFPFNPSKSGRSLNWRDKGIWLVDGKITEVDPKTGVGKILKRVDFDQGNIASSFAVIKNDRIYFAGKSFAVDGVPSDFYTYDLISGVLKKLPDIPSKATTPKSAFIDGDYLYFGGGFYRDYDNKQVEESYRFNLNTEKWEPWAKIYKKLAMWDFETTFNYNGEVYGLVNEISDAEEYVATKLMRFNRSKLDWDELTRYPYLGFANGNVAMPIGNKVYAFIKQQAYEIDMSTYKYRKIQDVGVEDGFYEVPPLIFTSGGKMYCNQKGEFILYEFDPNYFKF